MCSLVPRWGLGSGTRLGSVWWMYIPAWPAMRRIHSAAPPISNARAIERANIMQRVYLIIHTKSAIFFYCHVMTMNKHYRHSLVELVQQLRMLCYNYMQESRGTSVLDWSSFISTATFRTLGFWPSSWLAPMTMSGWGVGGARCCFHGNILFGITTLQTKTKKNSIQWT